MLLELVLALVLFVAAAAVVVVGLNASVDSAERVRLQVHAMDLAVTVMSELQLGVRFAGNSGPEPFTGSFTNWTCEISSTPLVETSGEGRFAQVEVVVRHDYPALVYRLSQIIPVGSAEPTSQASP